MRTTAIRYCVGGPIDRPCLSFGAHAEGCESDQCRGCQPRQATQGYLCDSCDTYLRQWLDCTSRDEYRPNSVLWVHWWLGLAQSVRSQRSRWTDRVQSSRDDLPSPLSEAILDCRRLLDDRLYIAEERLREVLGQSPESMPPYRTDTTTAFLSRHVIQIEDDPDLCRLVWDRLQDSMVTAHRLAPWRAAVERLHGIPCPRCERATLAIYGGDDFATCQTCRSVTASRRFDQWVAMLDHEGASA